MDPPLHCFNWITSFIFFSTDPTRNIADWLVATLSYQVARAAGAQAYVKPIVRQDPHVLNVDFTK